MSEPKYNAVCPIKYTDKDGQEHTKWRNYGASFTSRKTGLAVIKLEAIPITGWDGTIMVMEQKEFGNAKPAAEEKARDKHVGDAQEEAPF